MLDIALDGRIIVVFLSLLFIPFGIVLIRMSINSLKRYDHLQRSHKHKEKWFVTDYYTSEYQYYTDGNKSRKKVTSYKMEVTSPNEKDSMVIDIGEREYNQLFKGEQVEVEVCRGKNDKLVDCSKKAMTHELTMGLIELILGLVSAIGITLIMSILQDMFFTWLTILILDLIMLAIYISIYKLDIEDKK
jgi:hypothetical protein